MASTPHDIAAAALYHYEYKLPNKGKPRENDEWTVYAAIVATTTTLTNNQIVVISCATGTKCTAVKTGTPNADAVLHDSHAEVLARRGLVRVLWHEIINHNSNDKSGTDRIRLLNKVSDNQFELRHDVQLHLYVSDSPCGDASIYPLQSPALSTSSGGEARLQSNNNGLQFTGAKVIVSEVTQISVHDCGVQACLDGSRVAREQVQLLGRLRSKSGRSNLQPDRRSESMSCSDKVARWCILGLQGSALLHHLKEPIRLYSIIVSRDIRSEHSAQLAALQRAVPDRVLAAKEEFRNSISSKEAIDNDSCNDVEVKGICIPEVCVIDQVFARGKASSEHLKDTANRKRKHDETKGEISKLSPTGVCLNWNVVDDVVELTVGARGIRQGKKPKTDHDMLVTASRLSRHGFWQIASQASSCGSYAQFKASRTRQTRLRQCIFKHGPLAGWILGGDDGMNQAENKSQECKDVKT